MQYTHTHHTHDDKDGSVETLSSLVRRHNSVLTLVSSASLCFSSNIVRHRAPDGMCTMLGKDENKIRLICAVSYRARFCAGNDMEFVRHSGENKHTLQLLRRVLFWYYLDIGLLYRWIRMVPKYGQTHALLDLFVSAINRIMASICNQMLIKMKAICNQIHIIRTKHTRIPSSSATSIVTMISIPRTHLVNSKPTQNSGFDRMNTFLGPMSKLSEGQI